MSEIRVELDHAVREPGDELVVRVEWSAAERPEEVRVSLLWHTAGKGTEDVEVVEQQVFEHPSSSGGREVTFKLPAFPWSFSGSLVSLVWAVEASLEPGGDVHRVELVMAPGGQEVRL